MKTKIIFFCLIFVVFGMCSRSKQDETFIDSIRNAEAESVDSVILFHQQKKKQFVVKDKIIIEEFVKCLNSSSPTSLEHPFARQSMNCTLYTTGRTPKFRLVVSTDTINGTFISVMNEDGWNLGAYRNDNLEMVVSKIINMKDVP